MKKRFVIAMGLSSLLVTSTALAQEAPVTADKSAPRFSTLDRGSDTSNLGIDASMTFLDAENNTAMRLDMHGQYVMPTGIGVYGSLPLSYWSRDTGLPGMGDTSTVALGNLELGGLYNHKINDKLSINARAGVWLPTADDSLEGGLTNLANLLPRMTDYYGMAAKTTTVRASASLIGKEGQFFYRADAGLDVPIDKPDNAEFDPLVRLNLGVGVNAGVMALAGEFVTVGTTGDVMDGQDRFIHSAALSATLTSNKKIQPSVSVILPVNGDTTEMFDASVMLGVQGRLP